MDNRPSWDEYLMGFAIQASERSSCDRKKVGCVFTVNHRPLVTGYNGAPSRMHSCIEVGHLLVETVENGVVRTHCRRVVHAERNAIDWAARYGIPLEGSTVYLTHYPCHICVLDMIQVGAVEIVYAEPFSDTLSEQFSREAGISIRQLIQERR